MNKKQLPNLTDLSLGLNVAAGFFVFTLIGYFIDQKRGEGHLGILLGMAIGLAYGGYEIWKLIRRQ
ncbi:MAG: AtpZ/AtpI family protein [Candidatus Omnitrophica bacterium]|nr:AtpZ/AtpI family protein [Candidatus Omnitrophota bacterium]